jgi:integrase
VKRPSGEDAVRTHIVSAEEEERYFAAAIRKENLHDLAKLILLQGARPEEILSLKKGSYNQERATIQILGGKTKAARRELHLCGESIEIVERRMRLGGPWLFPSVRRPGYHIVQLNNAHDSVCQDAEVSFVLYDLRHTFATRMAQGGIDIATLAAILGHSSLRIVQKYVHPTAEHQRAAMKAYEASRPKAKLRKVKG